MNKEQIVLAQIMTEVAKLENEVHAYDTAAGTTRPEGPSKGHFYERLGLFVVAMCRLEIEPQRALGLISTVTAAPDTAIEHLLLIDSLRATGETPVMPIISVPLGPES